MHYLLCSLRLGLLTWVLCCGAYTLVIWGIGQAFVPESADGSLVRTADGRLVGSSQLAQAFTQPGYLWPRPSAVAYAADATGGSNLSPATPEITARARTLLTQYALPAAQRLPADLVTASGSGVDPHVTMAGALVQAGRIAAARGVAEARVRELLEARATDPSGLSTGYRLVNVLEANLALDAAFPGVAASARP